MAPAVGLVWAGAVLALASSLRPPPRRARAMVPAPAGAPQLGTRWAPGSRVVEGIGRVAHGVVLALVGRGTGRAAGRADAAVCRCMGWAVIAAGLTAPVALWAAPFAALGVWALPVLRHRRAERRRIDRLAAGLPEVVDLLVLGIRAGLSVGHALDGAARRGTGPLAEELGRVMDQNRLGRRLADVLDDLPSRAGEATRPLATALASAERYGAPLGDALDRLADEVRRQRQRRAEEVARRVPVKLLFPLVTCTLPAFALLTVAPLLASALRSLRL